MNAETKGKKVESPPSLELGARTADGIRLLARHRALLEDMNTLLVESGFASREMCPDNQWEIISDLRKVTDEGILQCALKSTTL